MSKIQWSLVYGVAFIITALVGAKTGQWVWYFASGVLFSNAMNVPIRRSH